MNDHVKHNGVVYTPPWIVKIILDKTLPQNLANIAVCDPACGDGVFLVDLAKRICKQAVKSKHPRPYFKSLQKLTGFDIDDFALQDCRKKLDQILSEHFPGAQIDWNLHLVDGIRQDQWRPWCDSFDFVVGNPPYIRIQNLEEERRKFIGKDKWNCVSGCTDIYILFFEYAINILKDGGSLCFITPNSWLKNNAGKSLRKFLNSFNINYILDFDDYQVFDGVTTYTAITKVSKAPQDKPVRVEKFKENAINSNYRLIDYRSKWVCIKDEVSPIFDDSKDTVLGEIAKIQVGIQTLADKTFILPAVEYDNGVVTCIADGIKVPLEAEITKRIYKASVMQDGVDKFNRVIVFPYDDNGELLSESKLESSYPLAYSWLSMNKDTLLNRDKGKNRQYKWYEYGRGVGIKTGFGRKIITSGMNKTPNFQICNDEDSLFYSGYSIKPESWVDISKLLKELNSQFMELYIESVSKPFRSGWRSYAKSFIQDYPIKSSKVAL